MPNFTEETLSNWTKPASDSEETKLENARRMVVQCISNNEKLKSMSIDIFGQGSYANDTNVRQNSDIDINVCFTGGFYFDLPQGKEREEFGLTNSIEYSAREFKNDVEEALVATFGRADVIRKDKCITIKSNTYRVETDVVPTWNYRQYWSDKSYHEGVYFITDAGIIVKSYPKKHIANGILKNGDTSKRFKRLTRIFRKLRYKMIEDKQPVSPAITSFLLESLVWNVPNHIFNNNLTWTTRLREAIIYLYNNTKEDASCKDWGEVSDRLYLFHSGRKWTRQDVNSYLASLWNYIGFN